MKQEKIDAFLHYLEANNGWMTATQLAKHFHVSTRTIRNYVKQINEEETIISSSPEGYRLNKRRKVKTEQESFFQDQPTKRMHLLLKELILQTDGINIFDLSEKLFVSDSTVENDVTNANHFIKPYHLKIKQKKDVLHLIGEETAKRKLMSRIIATETSTDFLSLHTVQEAYPEYDIAQLKEKLIYILGKYNLYVNEYTSNSILLHLVITIDRIKENNSVAQKAPMQNLKRILELKAATDIAAMIANDYGVTLHEGEKYYLVLLLSSKTTLLNYQSITPETLTNYMDQRYVTTAKELLKKVHESYYIDIDDDEFFVKFTIHIRNLVFRARNEQTARNPLTYKLKDSYPLIYEISVFISTELQKMENITIKEDEIAYIAFHIGAYFERRKELENKILCAVICPIYYDMQVELVQKIEEKFRSSLEIIQVTAEANELSLTSHIELIISTLPIKTELAPVVFVHPYITESDYELIQNQLVKIEERKNMSRVKNYLEAYFNENLFMKNIYLDSDIDYIRFMSDRMQKMGFVDENYCQAVIEREKMSSTAFNNNVAIPHSVKMNALRTGICIISNDKAVQWGEEKIQIIAMIAVHKQEGKLFTTVFESFINVLSEWDNVKELTKADDYVSFMSKMAALMDKV
jgi:lichenan operon transcriptional antiterminator